MIQNISSRANFTFELLPPSGFGTLCNHGEGNGDVPTEPYGKLYRTQYLCGQGDVQDAHNFTTDLYQSMFYVTPERRLFNRFTTPFIPPSQGGVQLMGTATNIKGLEDLIRQQKEGKQMPLCVLANTAYSVWLQKSFPALLVTEVTLGTTSNEINEIHQLFESGICETYARPNPIATRTILKLYNQGLCKANGKPFGIIGDPLPFGFNQFAMGVHLDLSIEVIDTIDYWMNELMTCSPTIQDDCDNFAFGYVDAVGTGDECGYVAFPPAPLEDSVNGGKIAGVILAIILGMVILGVGLCYYRKLVKRNKRIRKRFVQQVARNINLPARPDDVPVEKLAQLFEHIGGDKGSITEVDFQRWMSDIHLEFLSESELVLLWQWIDTKSSGLVTPIAFFSFLLTCEAEFAEVCLEINVMSKPERMKFTARDLSTLRACGEKGVRTKEFQIKRRGRLNVSV